MYATPQDRLERSRERQQNYEATITRMNATIVSDENQLKYEDFNRKLYAIEKQLYVLDNRFDRAQVSEKDAIKQQYETLKAEYDTLVKEFESFVKSL
jgi:hypothetical protein